MPEVVCHLRITIISQCADMKWRLLTCVGSQKG